MGVPFNCRYQALGWRQFGAVDPDLNDIFWSDTTIVSSSPAVNTGRKKDPQLQTALELGRTSASSATRAQAYQSVNERLAGDLPSLWPDRGVWAIVSTPKVQNWNNPRTPTSAAAYGMIGGSIWPTQIWMS